MPTLVGSERGVSIEILVFRVKASAIIVCSMKNFQNLNLPNAQP
jgi:hypothetical protein